MRLHRWVMTDRQRRVLRNIGLVVSVLLIIGLLPPMLWVFLTVGIGYGMWRFAAHVRRDRLGKTRTL